MAKSLIIAEGTAEQAILEILLENDYLKVATDDLISDTLVIPKLIKGQEIADKYLQRSFDSGIALIVGLDSLKRSINIPFAYKRQISETYYYVTRPEIEAIQLHADPAWRNQYLDYREHLASGDPKLLKPSAFFKASPQIGGLGFREIKSYEFVRRLWENRPDALVEAIKQVQREMRKHVVLGNRHPLADLLRPDLIYV